MKATGITDEKRHDKILTDFTFNPQLESHYNSISVDRIISYKVHQEYKSSAIINVPQKKINKVSGHGVLLYPEVLEYSLHLNIVGKKLLLYLIFHDIDFSKGNNLFSFNQQTIRDFCKYCQTAADKEYKPATIKQEFNKQILRYNIACFIKQSQYMFNPMLACSLKMDSPLRERLINEYTKLLLNKKKSSITSFYPVFK